MPELKKRIIVEGVDFGQLFWFPRILRAATASLQPSRLLIALFMVMALIAFGRLWDRVTTPSVPPEGLLAGRWTGPVEVSDLPIAVGLRPLGAFEATLSHVANNFQEMVWGVLSLHPSQVFAGLNGILIETPWALIRYHHWFALFYGIVFLIVSAVGGGAISRMAAVQAARGDRISIREAIDFAVSHWGRLIWAQVLPLLIAAIVGFVILIMGVLMSVPVLDVLGGLLYGGALVLGFLIAFLIVGYLLGFPMLVPAVACENCDGADAMQRAFAYVVMRPLNVVGYWIVALIGLALGFLLVSVVSVLMLDLTAKLFGQLNHNPAMMVAGGYDLIDFGQRTTSEVGGSWHNHWAATLIDFWEALVLCVVVAYVVAYHFGASTIIYLLMRRVCDGQDVEEVWLPGLMPGTSVPVPGAPETVQGGGAGMASGPATAGGAAGAVAAPPA